MNIGSRCRYVDSCDFDAIVEFIEKKLSIVKKIYNNDKRWRKDQRIWTPSFGTKGASYEYKHLVGQEKE